jgi:hypothetical protein
MRGRALPFLMIALLSGTAEAQIIWQPTPQPLVTAEHETWFMAGDPISFDGALYVPSGATQAFSGIQMVRSGSYRGIPLYTDATLQPYSVVFVPVAGNRMQPYVPAATTTSGVTQAAGPPTYAPSYELGTAPEAGIIAAVPPRAVGTTGRVTTEPVYVPRPTNSVVTTTNRPFAKAATPKGISGAWLDYDGRRWVAIGKGVDVTPDLHRIGTYHKFPVYARGDDRSTIYVPSAPGVVVPFRVK